MFRYTSRSTISVSLVGRCAGVTLLGRVPVNTTGEAFGGITEFEENSRGRHKVTSTVDSKRFLDHDFTVTRRS